MSEDEPYEVVNKESLNVSVYEKQHVIIDLLAQLATVLNENAKLERENSDLKCEKQDVMQKCADLERNMNVGKETWMKDAIESQIKIHEKDTILAKKDVERLEEQKLSLLEINNLKLSVYEQKQLYEARESELVNKVKTLKTEINYVDTILNDLKSNAQTNYNKYAVYKKKVKFAVLAITELMQKLKKYEKMETKMAHKAIQTDTLMYSSHHRIFNLVSYIYVLA
ncbi:hypothetical protein FQR65_LT00102 [Abscondita terminalis]|nr:hypothetical protein FQR65_LT00102 [Abscondita terminalis]